MASNKVNTIIVQSTYLILFASLLLKCHCLSLILMGEGAATTIDLIIDHLRMSSGILIEGLSNLCLCKFFRFPF